MFKPCECNGCNVPLANDFGLSFRCVVLAGDVGLLVAREMV